MAILVTGGAGYIGSHVCVELMEAGYEVVIADALFNSGAKAVDRIKRITKKDVRFYKADIMDRAALEQIFSENKIDAVIHLAGLKAVGESVAMPLEYYHNNICGTLALLDAMRSYGCLKLIFSSSATVYGNPAFVPITEDCPKGVCTNPYGWTKWMIEQILNDIYTSDKRWEIVSLRYFNPIGAHKSGLIGEDPKGVPNNLLPYISQVAVGKRPYLNVFGNDYDTPDGTGVRDYIHVTDLALGHVSALLSMGKNTGVRTYNLGTGKGYSVLEVVAAFERASGKNIDYKICERRPGDIAICYCDPSKAQAELGWRAQYGIGQMCEDSFRWQSMNPEGFGA